MSVQKSNIIIVGQKWKSEDFHRIVEENTKREYYDIVESFSFHNFDSDRQQNMDGTLKYLDTEEYVILGIPIQVSYEEEGFNIFTFDQSILNQVGKDVLIQLYKHNFHTIMQVTDFDVKMHVLTYYT